MKTKHLALLLCFLCLACSRSLPDQSMWTGTLELAQGTIHLPFRMFLDLRSAKPSGYFLIGDEKAPIPEITRQNDSLTFTFSEYGAQMSGSWNGSELAGTYERRRASGVTTLKFTASPETSAPQAGKVNASVPSPAGKYHVRFDGADKSEGATLATFWLNGDSVYGTLIAPDGDYGLLTGKSEGGKIQIGRFTGWQAIAFTLTQNEQSWSGNYYFQNDKPRKFTLEPAENLELAPPENLQASIKDPTKGFTFEGVSISGETVRSSDDRFKGKPLVVDVMGTWCHNCIDESPLLQELQAKYGKDGLEVVGISFEISDDVDLAKKNLKLYRDRLGLTYTTLFCGSLDDANVNKRLKSQLNNFFAYPTTLFIGRDGKVQSIHSGFKGPGTGEEFQAQVREFHALAAKLVD